MKNTKKCISLTLAAALLLTGCGGGASDNSGNTSAANDGDKKVLTFGCQMYTDGIVNTVTDENGGWNAMRYGITEGLFKFNDSMEVEPWLADSYTVNDEHTEWVITLKDGIKFSDGCDLTPTKVKECFEYLKEMGPSGSAKPQKYLEFEATITADDAANTLTIQTTQPYANLPGQLAHPTMAIVDVADTENFDNGTIGTGPYKYVSRSPQENVILEKFDEYWGTPANIDTVKLQVIANADTIVTSLNGGSVDMFARISQAQADQLSGDFDVLEGTMNLVQAMYLNNAKEPFNDVRVRQALCYAVDPQGIMDMISDGKGTQIGSSMFPSFGKYYMEELNDLYATNIEKAKELLTEAGYPDGFSFTLTVPSNYQQHVDTAQVIAEQLKEIGVTANIQLIEWESWLSDVYSDRNYEATVVGVDASSLTAAALLSRFESTASNNFINFNDPAYDEAYKAAAASADDDEKTGYYKECEKILAEDAANVYIQDLPSFVALNKKYGGYEFYPLYVQDFAKLYIVDEQTE